MRPSLALAVGALGLAVLPGCGYSLVGRGVNVDPSIRRIGVPLFKDETGRPGLDQTVTEKVIEELLKRGRFDVVSDATGVDAVVEGEIVSFRVLPIGFSQEGTGTSASTQASRYALVMRAHVVYRKLGATEPIWENASVQAREEADVGDSSTAFFDRGDQTVDQLASSFAKSLVASMLEAF
jgi:Lipopolysaccharide-assembly